MPYKWRDMQPCTLDERVTLKGLPGEQFGLEPGTTVEVEIVPDRPGGGLLIPDVRPHDARIAITLLGWIAVALDVAIMVGAIAIVLESCGVRVIR